MKKVIIVGASSGIGKEIALLQIKNKNKVFIVARREDRLREINDNFSSGNSNIFHQKHDVNHFNEVEDCFNQAVTKMGGLDEIYYVSGLMIDIEPFEFNFEKDLQMLNVNLLGCMAWLGKAADYFVKQKKGKIIGVSSVTGERGRRKNPAYHTAKSGMNTYLESLRNRLSIQGIQVLTVKPGFVKTEMTEHLQLKGSVSAEFVAKSIVTAANVGKDEIFIPFKWRIISFILRNIPSFIFKKLSI